MKTYRYIFFAMFTFLYVQVEASEWRGMQLTNPPYGAEDSSSSNGAEYAMAVVKGEIYRIGGRYAPVNLYSSEKKQWVQLANPPVNLHHFQARVYQDEIYVIGGFTGDYPDDIPLKKIYIYNPKNNKWRSSSLIPEQRRRGATALVLDRHYFYLLGGVVNGHKSGTVAWVDRYDLKSETWEVMPDMPSARDHLQATIVDEKIVIVGGRKSSVSTNEPYGGTTSKVDIYDIRNRVWSTLTSKNSFLKTPRSGASVLEYKGNVLILGGESQEKNDEEKKVHHIVDAFKIEDESWFALPSMISPQNGFQAVTIDNRVYISVEDRMEILDIKD